MRVLASCVAEVGDMWANRVESWVLSIRALGGPFAGSPVVVNLVGEPPADMRARFERFGAEVRVVEPWGGGAPNNKLRMFELGERDDFDVLLALDCDTVVVGDPTPHLHADAIGAAPADMNPLSRRKWEDLFAALGLRTDGEVTATDGTRMPAYFNSGVVAVPRTLLAGLTEAWVDAVARIEALFAAQPFIVPRPKQYFVDQYALAFAMTGYGMPHRPLSPAVNFPTHVPVKSPAAAGVDPVVLHYHAEVDEHGFLLQPIGAAARAGAEAFNQARARELGLAYPGMQAVPALQQLRRRATHRAWEVLGSQRWYQSEPVQRARAALRDRGSGVRAET